MDESAYPTLQSTVQGVQAYNGPAVQSQLTIGAGQPLTPVFMHPKAPAVTYGNYRSKQSLGLGITMIIVGVLAVIFNSVGLSYSAFLNFVGYGIWGGIFFIITGIFGIVASKSRSRCHVVSFMVLCVISASIAAVLFALGLSGAILDAPGLSYYAEPCYNPGYYAVDSGTGSYYTGYYTGYYYSGYYTGYYTGYYNSDYYNRGGPTLSCAVLRTVMNSILGLLGLIAGIAAIWGSALGCKVACCCSSSFNPGAVPVQYVALQMHGMPNNQQMILIPQTQQLIGGQMIAVPQVYPGKQTVNFLPPAYCTSYGPPGNEPVSTI